MHELSKGNAIFQNCHKKRWTSSSTLELGAAAFQLCQREGRCVIAVVSNTMLSRKRQNSLHTMKLKPLEERKGRPGEGVMVLWPNQRRPDQKKDANSFSACTNKRRIR
jgi:hypothetical protein